MRVSDIIQKKRDGFKLSDDEIDFFIKGYTNGAIPDYQASALLMAIYFQGLDKRETASLTMSMINSGDTIDLSKIDGVKVDKHSTGGVGDKTSLVLIPLIASAGVKVAKMSGRGLGHTGGTLDKLESINDFKINLSESEFIENVNKYGLAIVGQTSEVVPADKKLYSLRDVTATVDNISLIASSIMSKKLATGADAIVLDVKVGSGAFMKTLDDAIALSKEMVDIGVNLGRKVVAVISDMNEPLGFAVGNALEIVEAIETLHGNGPSDLEELCIELGAHMLKFAKGTSLDKNKELLRENLRNEKAFEKLCLLVEAQHGDTEQIRNPKLLPGAIKKISVSARVGGFISAIDAEAVGMASMFLGGGRATKEGTIDYGVGIVLDKKVGDFVKTGDSLATMYVNSEDNKNSAIEKLYDAFQFSPESVIISKLIYGIVDENGFQADI